MPARYNDVDIGYTGVSSLASRQRRLPCRVVHIMLPDAPCLIGVLDWCAFGVVVSKLGLQARIATGNALLDCIAGLLLVPLGGVTQSGGTHEHPGPDAAAARAETALRETIKLLRCLGRHLWALEGLVAAMWRLLWGGEASTSDASCDGCVRLLRHWFYYLLIN